MLRRILRSSNVLADKLARSRSLKRKGKGGSRRLSMEMLETRIQMLKEAEMLNRLPRLLESISRPVAGMRANRRNWRSPTQRAQFHAAVATEQLEDRMLLTVTGTGTFIPAAMVPAHSFIIDSASPTGGSVHNVSAGATSATFSLVGRIVGPGNLPHGTGFSGNIVGVSGESFSFSAVSGDTVPFTVSNVGLGLGDNSFTYQVGREGGPTSVTVSSLTSTIRINAAPNADNDTFNLDEDEPLAANRTINVLANDEDGDGGSDADDDGDNLTIDSVTDPSNGTTSITGDNRILYTPDPDFSGSDSFTYKISDGTTTSVSATVNITVNPIPEQPGTLNFVADSGTVGDNITNDLTPTFSGTADPGDTVRIERTDTSELIGTMTADGTTGMFTIPFAGATALTDGQTVTFVAIPTSGGSDGPASDPLAITFDTTPPQNVMIATVAADTGQAGDAVTNDTTPVFSGSVTAGEPNGPVTITVNRVDDMGTVVEAVGTATANAGGAWTTASYTGTALSDLDTFDVIARATDAAGNFSDSPTFPVVIDNRDPALANLKLDDGDNLYPDSVLDFAVTASMDPVIRFDLTEQIFPGGQDVLVEVFLGNSTDVSDLLNMTTVTFGNAATPSDSPMTNLSIEATGFGSLTGRQTLTLRATDLAGNTASATQQVFVSEVGAATPGAPGTPVLTDVYDLSAILADDNTSKPSQVWQMGFDKTTQTIWVNTELGSQTFQIDPATGQINLLDFSVLANNINTAGDPEIVSAISGLSVSTDPGINVGNPHGIFFDFDTAQTPRIWIAHRTAGGSGAGAKSADPGARLSFYDLDQNEFVTYEFNTMDFPGIDDLHAVSVDDTGVIWTVGTHSNTVYEIRMNTEDPTDRGAVVIPHVVPSVMNFGGDSGESFDPHGIEIIVDERTGEKYVWLISEGGSGRIALLRPHLEEDDAPGSNDDIDDDVWITWDIDSGEGNRGTFLKVDNNETPGIPEDDVIIGTVPVGVGTNPKAFAGVLQVLDPGSVAMDPNDLSEPATLRTFSIDQIPGGAADLAAINQPYLDREGNVYFIDRVGSVGRVDRNGMTPVTVPDLVLTAIVVKPDPSMGIDTSPLPEFTFLDPAVFGSNTGRVQVFDATPFLTDMGLVAPPVELDDVTHQTDRSQTAGLDLYEVANTGPGVSAKGRGAFRGTFNATNVLYSSLAQNDDIGSTVFSETTRRRMSVVTSDNGGRMAFQTMRNGSLLMTSRGDGDLFDEQLNLTREIVLHDGIDPTSAAFGELAIDGDPSALREADGSVHVFGRNVDNNVIIYQFNPGTGLWTTMEVDTPGGAVLVGNPVAFNDGTRGPAAVATTSDGSLILFRPDGSTTDLTALAADPTAARVYANPGIVDDVAAGRIYAYASDMSGNVVQYRFGRTGVIDDLVAARLDLSGAVRPMSQTEQDTRMLQDIDVVVSGSTRHVFATDGHSRLVHWEVTGDASVDTVENVSQTIADAGSSRVTGYFDFQMPFVARVYSEVAPVVETDGSLTVYGTNGGDLVQFYQKSGDWNAANLSKDANPADSTAFTPANFVFGASAAYLDQNNDRHSLQINGKGEVVEYTFDRSTGTFSTQNINLARGNSAVDLTSLAAPAADTDVGTETIIDNGAAGYSLVLGTSTAFASGGFSGDAAVLGGPAGPNDGTSIAQWEFTGLPVGTYAVSATWTANASNAGNSTFVVIADDSTAGQVRVNQQQTPGDFTESGAFWQKLLTSVTVTDGTLTVLLGDDANGQVIADAIRIVQTSPLNAAGGEATTVAPPQAAASVQEVEVVLDSAIAILANRLDLSADQEARLNQLTPVVIDLPGAMLGGVTGNQLLVDVNAAGYGWFIDLTPERNEDFVTVNGQMQANANSAAANRIDLLTVLLHELSHSLGQNHAEESENSLLSEELGVGTRRLPVAGSDTAGRLTDVETSSSHANVDDQFSTDSTLLNALSQL